MASFGESIELWHLIIQIHHYFINYGQSQSSRKQADKLTLAQIRLLLVLCQYFPRPLMLKELAEELELTPGAVSQTVDVLCRAGKIDRRICPDDRRSVRIGLSPEGQRSFEEMRNRVDARFVSCLSQVSDKDLKKASEVLSSLLVKTQDTSDVKKEEKK